MLTLTEPQSKSHLWSCRCFLGDIVIQYVKTLGMQMRHKPLTTGLFCTSSVLRAMCPQLEIRMQQNQFVTRLHCSHRRHEDWQVTSDTQWRAPSASSGLPSKVAFLKEKYSTSSITSLATFAPFSSTIFQRSSGLQLWRSLAFLASVQDGRAYKMSFLSLIDNDNKSKAITYKILSSLRCCWMSAGTAAFPHKHFRYSFLLFG